MMKSILAAVSKNDGAYTLLPSADELRQAVIHAMLYMNMSITVRGFQQQ